MATDIKKLAEIVDTAAIEATAIPQLSQSHSFTLDEAYDIQAEMINRRLVRGEVRVGMKMGFTSRAKMIQMGVDDMIWGRLTDGGVISLRDYVHPRVEPEVAFLLKKPLTGPTTPMQAMAAVEAIAPALEIIDSRYEAFKFNVQDVVADNASSTGFVIGPWCPPDTDLDNLGGIMEFNGRPVQIGSTAAILGHPGRSLAAASRMTAEEGETLEVGWIVMAGGVTEASPLSAGISVRNSVEGLGSVGFKVVE
ncbi:MAG: fumarylacetoacetate hydrolase family protein [Proteobacteria bacterium]|nr:fumarylacetoacetate hydrolase family protein [Pseudomonadota bacterium]